MNEHHQSLRCPRRVESIASTLLWIGKPLIGRSPVVLSVGVALLAVLGVVGRVIAQAPVWNPTDPIVRRVWAALDPAAKTAQGNLLKTIDAELVTPLPAPPPGQSLWQDEIYQRLANTLGQQRADIEIGLAAWSSAPDRRIEDLTAIGRLKDQSAKCRADLSALPGNQNLWSALKEIEDDLEAGKIPADAQVGDARALVQAQFGGFLPGFTPWPLKRLAIIQCEAEPLEKRIIGNPKIAVLETDLPDEEKLAVALLVRSGLDANPQWPAHSLVADNSLNDLLETLAPNVAGLPPKDIAARKLKRLGNFFLNSPTTQEIADCESLIDPGTLTDLTDPTKAQPVILNATALFNAMLCRIKTAQGAPDFKAMVAANDAKRFNGLKVDSLNAANATGLPLVHSDANSPSYLSGSTPQKIPDPNVGFIYQFPWKAQNGDAHALDFVKVPNGAYLSRDDVDIALFADLVNNDKKDLAIWTALIPERQLYHGPIGWKWDRNNGGLVGLALNDQWWMPDIAVQNPAFLYDPAFRGKTPGPMDKPGKNDPMQQLPPQAALRAARLLGCRLPTLDEWKKAVEPLTNAAGGFDTSGWNLRGTQYDLEDQYLQKPQPQIRIRTPLSSLVSDIQTTQTKNLPGASLQQEGAIWFRPVNDPAQAKQPFRNIVGNVWQYVSNDNSTQPDLAAISKANPPADAFSVVGASSLSAWPSPPPNPNTLILPVKESKPYCDVGFRLAMDADNRTPDQQVEEQLADAFKKGTLVYLP